MFNKEALCEWIQYMAERPFGEHGHTAAVFISGIRKTFLKDLTDDQIKILKLAYKHHTTKRCTKDLTADICLDADRLDLNRVAIKPDPKKMATETGARFAQMTETELKSRKDIYFQSVNNS